MRRFMHVRNSATPGQALIEFALVLPVFLTITLLCIQLCVLGVRWWQLNSAAGAIVRQAAAGNGETHAVDDAVLRIAASNGLHSDRLWAQVDTDEGDGHLHRADQTQPSDAPPPATYGGMVTVHLTYQAPLLFGLVGGAVLVGATFSQESAGAYGGLAP